MTIRKDIKSRLKNSPKEALYSLDSIVSPNAEIFDEFAAIQSRLNDLLRRNGRGVISDSEYAMQYSKICDSILYVVSKLEIEDLIPLPTNGEVSITDQKKSSMGTYEVVEYGVVKIREDTYRISTAPTVFFSDRFCKAFPGTRGIEVFEDTAIGLYRLNLLLKSPVYFEEINGYGAVCDPIWWFRGRKCMYINEYEAISNEIGLLGARELYKPKVIAYSSTSYYKSFVYVRIEPNDSVGIYTYTDEQIQEMIQYLGYYAEEYAIFQGKNIKREEFDDGAAIVDGRVVDLEGLAKLRMRYLTNYNLIICAKFNPLNNVKVSGRFEKIMEKLLLENEHNFEELVEFVEQLSRHHLDD